MADRVAVESEKLSGTQQHATVRVERRRLVQGLAIHNEQAHRFGLADERSATGRSYRGRNQCRQAAVCRKGLRRLPCVEWHCTAKGFRSGPHGAGREECVRTGIQQGQDSTQLGLIYPGEAAGSGLGESGREDAAIQLGTGRSRRNNNRIVEPNGPGRDKYFAATGSAQEGRVVPARRSIRTSV